MHDHKTLITNYYFLKFTHRYGVNAKMDQHLMKKYVYGKDEKPNLKGPILEG